MRRLALVAAALGGLPALASTAIATTEEGSRADGHVSLTPDAGASAKRIVIGRSVRGRPIRAVRVGDPESERVALIVGVVHGDERAGLGITERVRRMGRGVRGAQIWVIDNLNPDGTRMRTRKNARGVDLNRNFPHRWRGGVPPGSGYYPGRRAASEPETRAAMALIRKIRPDVSIWYHQPWGAVLACRGRPQLAYRYAKLAGERTSCRGRGLRGTAIGWTKAKLQGSAAFVVELGSGGLPGRSASRHARAAVAVSEAK
jgi:murein peptide amidase A